MMTSSDLQDSSSGPIAPPDRRRGVLLAIFAVVFCLAVWQTAQLSYSYFLGQTQAQSQQKLNLYAQNLRRSLERYEFLPLLYASHTSIAGLLADPSNPEFLAHSNRLIERVNRLTGSAGTYLLDVKGVTLAASDWDQKTSFIGKNFGSEPYFKAAMQGRLGRYYASSAAMQGRLGRYYASNDESSGRGYYFASPVRRNGVILGVIVTIIGVEDIEDSWWTTGRSELFVTDDQGVVFISSRPQWRYRQLPPSPAENEILRTSADAAAARRSGRHNRIPILPFDLTYSGDMESGGRMVHIAPPSDTEGESDTGDSEADARMVHIEAPANDLPQLGKARVENFLFQSLPMRELGWTLHFLADISALRRQTATVTILVGAVLIALGLGTGVWVQRQRNRAQRAVLRDQSRRALESAYGELENRVTERTRALVDSNLMLTKEIGERRRAEDELRQTQDDLVQAEKLAALGHISAGISHELNQPLTAIRSFSENARKLLDRKRYDDVDSNLSLISELTGRMAQLMKQLRTFARKAPVQTSVVSLDDVLARTLALLKPRIDDMGVALELETAQGLDVMADALRLEQVLGNLIGNALDALQSAETPKIEMSVTIGPREISLSIRDNGPGIPRQYLNEIFDPFFTTKDVGQGLGLGLSITYGIVKDFGGTIRASNHEDGGAVFTLNLPRSAEQQQQERKAG